MRDKALLGGLGRYVGVVVMCSWRSRVKRNINSEKEKEMDLMGGGLRGNRGLGKGLGVKRVG